MLSYDEAATTSEIVDESLHNLQLLEDRVRGYVEELRGLREENNTISSECTVLKERCGELEGQMGDQGNWEAERELLQNENRSLKEKIGVIEDRIRGILQRLEISIPQE